MPRKNHALLIPLILLLSSCVYHPRRVHSAHAFEYDHKDVEVVFPWRTTTDFEREFEIAVIPSILIWFSFPVELIEGFARFDIVRMLTSPAPALYRASLMDREMINFKAKRARNMREEQRENGLLEDSD